MSIKVIQARCATSEGISRKDIFFDTNSGLITKVQNGELVAGKVDYFYNDDILLFAGMGDIHIHAREDITGKNNYKEDFYSTCCAAQNGGLVHVADMPNNPIPPIDDQSYLAKVELAKDSEVPILMYAGIGPNTRPLSFLVPYKVYMGPSIGELYFKNADELKNVLKYYQNQNVSFHCEDPEILEKNKEQPTHFLRRPIEAEIMATTTAIDLIKQFNLKGKLCHYSAGAGLLAILKAKQSGADISCEVTPQHLYFSEEKIAQMKPHDQLYFQMNPPIRSNEDRQKLLAALKNGEIDFLATDHAPHSQDEKLKGMSGLPGLDTYAGFVTWLLLTERVSPEVIALVTTENPGSFFNKFLKSLSDKAFIENKWGKGIGFLEVGFSASFTLLNLKKPHSVTLSNIKTKANWSPFLGITFPGSLEQLFLRGMPKNN